MKFLNNILLIISTFVNNTKRTTLSEESIDGFKKATTIYAKAIQAASAGFFKALSDNETDIKDLIRLSSRVKREFIQSFTLSELITIKSAWNEIKKDFEGIGDLIDDLKEGDPSVMSDEFIQGIADLVSQENKTSKPVKKAWKELQKRVNEILGETKPDPDDEDEYDEDDAYANKEFLDEIEDDLKRFNDALDSEINLKEEDEEMPDISSIFDGEIEETPGTSDLSDEELEVFKSKSENNSNLSDDDFKEFTK
jgi:hypothetical protein